MLVNDRSIVKDTPYSTYDVYHIELEEHCVLVSNGFLTESYIDTGNRRFFEEDKHNTVVNLSTSPIEYAYPLNTDRIFVEPKFYRLLKRAVELNFPYVEKKHTSVLTQDAQLRLLINNSLVQKPFKVNDKIAYFILPKQSKEITLLSRAARPTDVIGPYVNDRRILGVFVKNITIFEDKNKLSCSNYQYDNYNLNGWHSCENNQGRWTNGSAALSLTEFNHPIIIGIEFEKLPAYYSNNPFDPYKEVA